MAILRGALVLAAWLAFVGTPAQAGNRYTYLIGARAAGMAGAFTALANDGSAAWYNPAALSLSDRHSFDLSATAYGLEIREVPGLIRTTFGGDTGEADLAASTLNIVPSSLDMVYRLSAPGAAVRHVLALSVLVPEQSDLSARFDYRNDDFGYAQKIVLSETGALYYIGPSYGVWLNEHVSVGGSFFLTYEKFDYSSRVQLHGDVARGAVPADLFALIEQSAQGWSVGLVLSGAVHLRYRGWRAGLTARTPVFRVFRDAEVSSVEALSDPSVPTSDFVSDDRSLNEWGFAMVRPAEIRLGLGYEDEGVWRVGLDASWHSPLSSSAEALDWGHTFNVALGVEVHLLDWLPLAFGFFTDFHPERRRSDFGEAQTDYYGGTLALSFLSPYEVSGSDKTDRIVFTTTVGLHYAYGAGRATGLHFDYDTNTYDETSRPLRAHDVHVFAGSSVQF